MAKLMRPRVRPIPMRLLLVALLVALAPGVAAQAPALVKTQVTVAVDADAKPMPVGIDTSIPYTVEVAVEGPGRGTVRVTLSIAGGPPPLWDATVQPAEHTIEIPPGTSYAGTLEGVVALRPHAAAPALERTPFRLAASMTGNELIPSSQAETNWESRADWRPGLAVNASAPTLTIPADGGASDALADVRVTGNAIERVGAEVVDSPEGCAALPPAARSGGAGAALPTTIRVQCGSSWTPGKLVVRFTHVLMVDPTREGPATDVTWDVQASAAAAQERSVPVAGLAAAMALALAVAVFPRPKR